MIDLNKEIPNENLTQKDIMQFLLHSTQHVATREELQDVKSELKQDISKLDDRISIVETSLKQEISKVDDRISKVETSLKQDISKLDDKISKVETSLKQEISKVDSKFDKIQWLIIATIMTVLLKDYIFSLIEVSK